MTLNELKSSTNMIAATRNSVTLRTFNPKYHMVLWDSYGTWSGSLLEVSTGHYWFGHFSRNGQEVLAVLNQRLMENL